MPLDSRADANSLPTQCQVCQLKLMSSVELTKTYHHLFPVPAFAETKEAAGGGNGHSSANGHSNDGRGSGGALALMSVSPSGQCFACSAPLPAAAPSAAQAARAANAQGVGIIDDDNMRVGSVCPGCQRRYCASCDELVHGALSTCPGCELLQGK